MGNMGGTEGEVNRRTGDEEERRREGEGRGEEERR